MCITDLFGKNSSAEFIWIQHKDRDDLIFFVDDCFNFENQLRDYKRQHSMTTILSDYPNIKRKKNICDYAYVIVYFWCDRI